MLSARGAVRCLRRCLEPEVVLESSSVGFGSRQRAWHRHPFFTEPFIFELSIARRGTCTEPFRKAGGVLAVRAGPRCQAGPLPVHIGIWSFRKSGLDTWGLRWPEGFEVEGF